MLKDMDFCHLREIYQKGITKHLLDTGLHSLKTASKTLIHKAAEATGEFIGNKAADAVAELNDDKIVKTKHLIDENSRSVEKIIIPPEKREEILNESRQVL